MRAILWGIAMSALVTEKLHEQFDAGLVTRADFTIDQPVERYTTADHAVWQQLYARQTALLRGRVCEPFLRGIDRLGLAPDRIPNFNALSDKLMPATGWQIVAVPGLVPDEVFFDHLANRRFPVTWWMRGRDKLDYLQEPDCFHDLFGHVPLLSDPVFADYMQLYGQQGRAAGRLGVLPMLARLYWYTVEFGLIRDASAAGGLKIYGAGIASSRTESIYSLESDAPNRLAFALARVVNTRYRIDTVQKTYFVIDSFEQLFEAVRQELGTVFQQAAAREPYRAGDVLASDGVIQRGTGEGWLAEGDV
jgi:phenylalanine-4-hydroxylase